MVKSRGIISVIHGPMFSGKTEELLRRIRRARVARKKCQLFKPARDLRYATDRVVPHSLAGNPGGGDLGEKAVTIETAGEIQRHLEADVNLVGVEEAQFFDSLLFDTVLRLSAAGIDVVLSLLDQDFRRQPFPVPGSPRSVGDFLAIAHESVKLTAICMKCGREAQHSQKLVLNGVNAKGEPIYVPASFYAEVVAVGTGRDFVKPGKTGHPAHIYEARCLVCHEIPDEPGVMGSSAPKPKAKAKAAPEEEGEDVFLVEANDDVKPSPPVNRKGPEPKKKKARPEADDQDFLELAP